MENKQMDIFERIGSAFRENPKYFGLFILILGVLFLAGSVFNWNWFFEGRSFNLKKIEGIANMFGRKVARVWFGLGAVACIILGIVLLILG